MLFSDKMWEFWDLKEGKELSCPNCKKENVIFYFHNPIISGVEFSAECKECRYKEESNDPKFVKNWVLD